jgi:hypothetical protein
MDDSVLWTVALGIGGLGFLLLAIAGMVAMCLNIRARRARDAPSAGEPQSHAGDKASTGEPQARVSDKASKGKSRLHTGSSRAKHKAAGGFLAWVKAWVFALLHAGTVSVVLGSITFFEDLARANDEIQRTGTVTFPKQLLPGTLSSPTSRKHLSPPTGGLLKNGQQCDDDFTPTRPPGAHTGPPAGG